MRISADKKQYSANVSKRTLLFSPSVRIDKKESNTETESKIEDTPANSSTKDFSP